MNRIFGTTLKLPQTGRFSALAALLALAPLRRPSRGASRCNVRSVGCGKMTGRRSTNYLACSVLM